MSVVVPAHDEETIIERMLRSLVSSDSNSRLDIVVVANGCRDATADVAAAISPDIRVVQIPTASKIAALNAGDDAARFFPRAYVDADVTVSADALLAVADCLHDETGTFVGAPTLRIDVSGADWAVRQYYRVWEQSEYRATGHVGSGLYVLSRTGRSRFGRFPNVIADDRFVQQLFSTDERVTVGEHTFTVAAPRTFHALLNRATRIAAGNRQLTHTSDAGRPPVANATGNKNPARFGALFRRVLARPRLWLAFCTYCYAYLMPRVRARRMEASGRIPGWNRDETTRVGA